MLLQESHERSQTFPITDAVPTSEGDTPGIFNATGVYANNKQYIFISDCINMRTSIEHYVFIPQEKLILYVGYFECQLQMQPIFYKVQLWSKPI